MVHRLGEALTGKGRNARLGEALCQAEQDQSHLLLGCLGIEFVPQIKVFPENARQDIKQRIKMYAVIKSGGKQHRVEPGEILRIEKLDLSEGDKIDFDEVMLVGDDKDVQIGSPYLRAAKYPQRLLVTVAAIK